jgi:S-adenosylmethionine synthetase
MITSESVTEGHPDKLCDQISDAIVDRFLSKDPYARVRVECAVSSAILFIAARFSSPEVVDFSHVARKVIERIDYDEIEFNARTCSILTTPQELPQDDRWYFNEHQLSDEEIDQIPVENQVTVFGFACDQTSTLMPLPISLSHRLAQQLTAVRRQKTLPYLMSEGKVQVGVEYRSRKPSRIHSVTVTASQKRKTEPDPKTLRQDIIRAVVEPVFENEQIKPDKKTRIFVNPDGPFLGGPSHHCGLTGRKSGVDTYGEYSRHSGKALSGKDPLRIDRVGAYAARYAAKNVVAAGLASECEVMLSYSIGLPRPVSLYVETFRTETIPRQKITGLVREHCDFRLAAILRDFDLRRLPERNPVGFYSKLAAYGHFGRRDLDLPWEKTDRVDVFSER